LLVRERTGTGKTAAYIIGALHLLNLGGTREEKGVRIPQVLILTPTRELAFGVSHVCTTFLLPPRKK
jgi:superfamily II DNA/RNA helicase